MDRSFRSFIRRVSGNAGVTVIAHRGASAYYPENTIPAFEAAMSLGAHVVELDVQLTSDGKVVVFHDEELSRCTDGRGRVVDRDLAELKRLDAGLWFGKDFRGTRIPTLEEVLSVCRGRSAVNIEIKRQAVTGEVRGGIEERCLELVHRGGMEGQVILSSFDPRALKRLRKMDRAVALAVLYDGTIHGDRAPSEITAFHDAQAFNCSRAELKREWVADLRERQITLNVYTVNHREDMRRLVAMGVDGIFTDRPDVLREVVREGWGGRSGPATKGHRGG